MIERQKRECEIGRSQRTVVGIRRRSASAKDDSMGLRQGKTSQDERYKRDRCYRPKFVASRVKDGSCGGGRANGANIAGVRGVRKRGKRECSPCVKEVEEQGEMKVNYIIQTIVEAKT